MKRMAAHNYENLLQVSESVVSLPAQVLFTRVKCSIVVFDGLLPEPHNTSICKLLFVMSHWHALAKLRMHNDLTLDVMDAATISLGNALRHFSDVTSAAFETRELGCEYSARLRRKARTEAGKTSGATQSAAAVSTTATGTSTSLPSSSETTRPADPTSTPARKRVKFNLNTYKAHSFPDYVRTIRRFGTTDSYSTELVSLGFCFARYVIHCILFTGRTRASKSQVTVYSHKPQAVYETDDANREAASKTETNSSKT